MVEWLSGNRIRGTSTERTSTTGFNPVVGGWKEVARTTLESNGTAVDVTSIPDKRYYMILSDLQASTGTINPYSFINNLGGSSYSTSFVANNGNLNSQFGVGYGNYTGYGTMSTPYFIVDYWSNLANREKLGIRHVVLQNTAGEETAPYTVIATPKVTLTSSRITSFKWTGGTFSSGDEVVVLGWDPDDTHTTNFWEELASVDTGAGAILDSGTIAAKKYLWVQFFAETDSGSSMELKFNFNGDRGTNYARRNRQDGGVENAQTNNNGISVISSGYRRFFGNYFIINNSAKEKLLTGHNIAYTTAGEGTAPHRNETVGKWDNTSTQITQIEIVDTVQGDLGLTSGKIRVWGSD